MINILERTKKGDGIYFNKITDKRFKVSQYALYFYNEFDELPRPDYTAAAYIMSECCAKYPSHALMARRLSDLYDASLTSNIAFGQWNDRLTVFRSSILDNRYALGGEDLEVEICDLMRECILSPHLNNGVFDENMTSLARAEVIDDIDSAINEKSLYAALKSNQTVFAGEPMEIPINGTHEQAELITPASAFAAFQRLPQTAHIEIFAAGSGDFAAAEEILCSTFSEIKRHDIAKLVKTPSPLKSEPARVSDTLPMQQAILRMSFKAPDLEDREAMTILGLILGVLPTSRFFQNIREKQSLCYYCSCTVNKNPRVLTAYAGVQPENLKRTEEAILKELEDIQKNGVTKDEIETAMLDMRNQTSSINDSAKSLINWYSAQVDSDELLSPEQQAAEYEKVDAARIQEAARQFKLDTVYSLSGEG